MATSPMTLPEIPSAGVHSRSGKSEPLLNVCVLAACPFPANHGTPGSIREMSEAIAARGHKVHVVTYHFGQDIPLKDVRLHRIKPWLKESDIKVGPTSRKPLYDFQMVLEAIKVIREHKIDVIHAHGYEAALAARLCRLFTGRPFIYSAHNSMGDELASYDFFPSKRLADGVAWVLDATVPRMGNRCIPHSENIEGFLHDRGLKKRCEEVINFGIELSPWEESPHGQSPAAISDGEDEHELRRQYNLGEGPIIVYAGVMDHFQRLDLLLRGMKTVLAYNADAKLVLVVTIPDEKHLSRIREQLAELGIEQNVVLTDQQNLDGVRRFLRICDLTVVPRPGAPGFPIKLLNYMAAERACVMFASSSSGLAHQEHAWLVDEDSASALGQAMVRLLSDDAMRDTIARGGREFVYRHHDRRTSARKICQTYVRVLHRKRRWKTIDQRPRAIEP